MKSKWIQLDETISNDPMVCFHTPIDLRPIECNNSEMISGMRRMVYDIDPKHERFYVAITPNQFRIIDTMCKFPIDDAESLKRHATLFGYNIVVIQ